MGRMKLRSRHLRDKSKPRREYPRDHGERLMHVGYCSACPPERESPRMLFARRREPKDPRCTVCKQKGRKRGGQS